MIYQNFIMFHFIWPMKKEHVILEVKRNTFYESSIYLALLSKNAVDDGCYFMLSRFLGYSLNRIP